jgi:hypothetical protein
VLLQSWIFAKFGKFAKKSRWEYFEGMSEQGESPRLLFENANAQTANCLLCQKPVSLLIAYPHVKACLAKFEEAFGLTGVMETSPSKRLRESTPTNGIGNSNTPQDGLSTTITTNPQQSQTIATTQNVVVPAPAPPPAVVHRCDFGPSLCPKPDTNTKKSVVFELKNKTLSICKFQHLKSPTLVALLTEKLLTFDLLTVERPFNCFGCRTESETKVSVYCRNRIAVHDFCTIACALYFMPLYRQSDWERAVDNNGQMPLSSTGQRH